MIRALLYLLLLIIFVSCTEEPEERISSPGWGIEFSPVEETDNAFGYISLQNSESNEAFLVDAAYVHQVKGNTYKLTFNFTSSDSLRIIVAKRENDYNFHYPKPDTVNQLLLVIFNTDTLPLKQSSVFIQPESSSNKFRTVTNIHVPVVGSYNGTIDGVPLIE